MTLEWIIGGLWIACGVLAYGLTFAALHKHFSIIVQETYWRNLAVSLFVGVLGPLGLASIILHLRREGLGCKYGVKFWGLVLLLALVTPVLATESCTGRVVASADGDTRATTDDRRPRQAGVSRLRLNSAATTKGIW
jgi:hypothetical protein